MTGKLTEEDVEKLFKYLAEFISEHPERANEILEFAQTVKPLIQNQMTTADIYNEIAVENLELREFKQRVIDFMEKLVTQSTLTKEQREDLSSEFTKVLKGNSTGQ